MVKSAFYRMASVYGLGVEQFQGFKFFVCTVPLGKGCSQCFSTGLTERCGFCAGSWKTVPTIAVYVNPSDVCRSFSREIADIFGVSNRSLLAFLSALGGEEGTSSPSPLRIFHCLHACQTPCNIWFWRSLNTIQPTTWEGHWTRAPQGG